MQWSQIKTLFILCFLVLNIYLLFQLYEQQQKHALVDDTTESTFEEQLEEDNITVPNSVFASEAKTESFMTVEQKLFDEDEIEKTEGLVEQSISIIEKTLLASIVEEKIKIPENAPKEHIIEQTNNLSPYMSEYDLWKWDQDLNILIFFQQRDGQTIYYNENGLMLVFLNDENEVVFYSQTMLAEDESTQESQKLISPLRAIETIYNSGQLFFGDEINDVEVGFHTRIQSSSGIQVFVPTWKVIVNEEKNYFVNAIEGYVFASDDHEFLSETLDKDLKRTQSALEDKNKTKNKIVDYYKEKLKFFD